MSKATYIILLSAVNSTLCNLFLPHTFFHAELNDAYALINEYLLIRVKTNYILTNLI